MTTHLKNRPREPAGKAHLVHRFPLLTEAPVTDVGQTRETAWFVDEDGRLVELPEPQGYVVLWRWLPDRRAEFAVRDPKDGPLFWRSTEGGRTTWETLCSVTGAGAWREGGPSWAVGVVRTGLREASVSEPMPVGVIRADDADDFVPFCCLTCGASLVRSQVARHMRWHNDTTSPEDEYPSPGAPDVLTFSVHPDDIANRKEWGTVSDDYRPGGLVWCPACVQERECWGVSPHAAHLECGHEVWVDDTAPDTEQR